MYPALLTPEVVIKDQPIEFLLLTKERFADKAKLLEFINWQLKIIPAWTAPRVHPQPLLVEGKLTDQIKIHAD